VIVRVYRVVREFHYRSLGKSIPTGSVVYTEDDLAGWVAVSPPSVPDPLTTFVGGMEIAGLRNFVSAGLLELHGAIAEGHEQEEEVEARQDRPVNLGLSTWEEESKPVLRAAPQPNRPGYYPCGRHIELRTATLEDSFTDTKIDLKTMRRVDWGEVRLVGVYRDDNGSLVKCEKGAENAVLSVWDFQPNDQTPDRTPVNWDLKECVVLAGEKSKGCCRVDMVLGPEVHEGRGGGIRFASGAIGDINRSVGVDCPAALQLDAESRHSSSVVRVFVSYPLGQKETYVLRLATYRRLGTF